MKNVILIAFLIIGTAVFGQKKQKPVTDTIKTSAQCEMCKDLIEENLNYVNGVKFAELDFISQNLIIKYKPDVISKEEIKKIVASIGYDADDIVAEDKAYEELPTCCKKGAHHPIEE